MEITLVCLFTWFVRWFFSRCLYIFLLLSVQLLSTSSVSSQCLLFAAVLSLSPWWGLYCRGCFLFDCWFSFGWAGLQLMAFIWCSSSWSPSADGILSFLLRLPILVIVPLLFLCAEQIYNGVCDCRCETLGAVGLHSFQLGRKSFELVPSKKEKRMERQKPMSAGV